MLSYQWFGGQGTPVVFLHGLLGSRHDWAEVFALLQNFPDIRPLAIDLPYHHLSREVACNGFEQCRELLHQTLKNAFCDQPFYLVGYSLGGRIALDYRINCPNPHLLGTILEGANLGLKSDMEKAERWQNDQQWAARFETEPLAEVLDDWYRQPVFADLSENKRSEFIKKRQNSNGKAIAAMLRATSLAKQPDFSAQIQQAQCDFLIGERDHKFRQMAETNQLNYRLISDAGHNAHQANPAEFVGKLVEIIRR